MSLATDAADPPKVSHGGSIPLRDAMRRSFSGKTVAFQATQEGFDSPTACDLGQPEEVQVEVLGD